MPDLLKRITVEPDKCSGKPCVRGIRFTVDDMLSYLAGGMTPQEIVADFPYLELDDVRACLQWATLHGHRPTVPPGTPKVAV